MAIKGLAYAKTQWDFEERPVASAKLNRWDDRIEAALELAFFLLSQAWGGGDGVVRGASDDDLQVRATAIPGMTVEAMAGYAFISGYPYKLGEALETPEFLAPTTHDRIDVVAADLESGGLTVVAGVEAATPGVPATPAGHVALAQVYLRPGMTQIKNSDDSTNGYITDARTFV